jgi:hypothetical protein
LNLNILCTIYFVQNKSEVPLETPPVKAAKKTVATPLLPIFFSLLLLFSYGCASTDVGPLFLHPAGKAEVGYTQIADKWVYSGKSVIIRVSHVSKAETLPGSKGSVLIDELLERGYLLFKMNIRNDSKGKVIYNPSLTALKDNTYGYKKPLDYTDLYDLADDAAGPTGLSGFKGVFYDLSITLSPGERTSGLMAFRPLDKKVRKIELVIKNIYVGKDFLDVRFPFVLKPEASE